MLDYFDRDWGSGGIVRRFAPSRQDDPAFRQWMGRFERLGASPAAAMALMRMNSQIDITGVLSSIRVPTLRIHRTGDQVVNVEGGRFLAKHIPGARYVELPGIDHFLFEAVRPLGIELRMGQHTGEVELSDDDARGIAVHIASRVAALAGPSEILVSRTVRDLVAGSGIRFTERDRQLLHGLHEPMELYAVAD
jgi:hypothetical protein